MIKVRDLNPNTRVYWNNLYKGDVNRDQYTQMTKGFNGNSQRLATVLKDIHDGDKVLDIGCGIGLLTKLIKDNYPKCEVWGTDISDDAITENNQEHQDIKYIQSYVGEQKVPTNYFDVVFSGEVLEHIDEPKQLFQDAQKALKKDGIFILTTPNENHINSDEHVWSFTKEDIHGLFEENGFHTPIFTELPDMEHIFVIYAIGIKK